MTEAEALEIRKATAELYHVAQIEFATTYYGIFNKTPGDDKDFDAYVISRWEESKLQDAFYNLGSIGIRALIAEGWNPTLPPTED